MVATNVLQKVATPARTDNKELTRERENIIYREWSSRTQFGSLEESFIRLIQALSQIRTSSTIEENSSISAYNDNLSLRESFLRLIRANSQIKTSSRIEENSSITSYNTNLSNGPHQTKHNCSNVSQIMYSLAISYIDRLHRLYNDLTPFISGFLSNLHRFI